MSWKDKKQEKATSQKPKWKKKKKNRLQIGPGGKDFSIWRQDENFLSIRTIVMSGGQSEKLKHFKTSFQLWTMRAAVL